MQEATYWKKYEKFIKENLCPRRNRHMETTRLIDDDFEKLLAEGAKIYA